MMDVLTAAKGQAGRELESRRGQKWPLKGHQPVSGPQALSKVRVASSLPLLFPPLFFVLLPFPETCAGL